MDKIIQEKINRVGNLTAKMDVPPSRKTSIYWLNKNLAIRNSEHPDFKEAITLIEELIKAGVR